MRSLDLPTNSIHKQEFNHRSIRPANINPLSSLHEVRGSRGSNVHELLRIAVGQREPGALNLNHDSMSRAESVSHIRKLELDVIRLTGIEGYGLFEALAILAAERLAANQLLIAAHLR